jgi:hypothetical protein
MACTLPDIDTLLEISRLCSVCYFLKLSFRESDGGSSFHCRATVPILAHIPDIKEIMCDMQRLI